MKILRSAAVVVALMAVGAMAQGQQPGAQPAQPPAPAWGDEVLAIVNGTPVTRRQVWWQMEQGWGGKVLDDLIVGMLVNAEAQRQGVKVGAPEVDAEMARLKAEYDDEAAFNEMLHRRGQTLKGFRITVQRDLLIEKLLARRMGIDEDGLRAYFDAHREEFARPRKVHLYDIVTLTLEDAYAARERLASGEKFTAVAADMSHDPTAKKGGDRGWITREDVLNPKVADVVFAMEMGEVSDPVQCEGHCHVFYAAGVKPRELLSFEEARPEIIRALREKRGISKQFYITLLMREADISVKWPAHSYMNEMYADLRRIKVVVNGRRLDLPRPARILPDGNLIVPAAVMFTAMGATLEYTPETGVLEVTRGDVHLRLVKGAEVFAAGEREMKMKEKPVIEDGTMMISPRGPVEALGGSLQWNREENTLYVNSSGDDNSDAATVEEITVD
ncbi:MAG: peptidyl-prolyl cis-trans isomerase [Armatimonadetes bacterium]|nr:peptidyl-prolyl cis-trans isomerase [Armatimonadota bacterium]